MPKVVVGVSGSPGSLAALHRAAAEARARRAELCAVLAWQPPGGGPGGRSSCAVPAPAQWRAAAALQLREVLDAAFGTERPGVTVAGLTGGPPREPRSSTPPATPRTSSWSERARTARCSGCSAPRWPATASRTPPAPC
ncbi:universal stress protein [Streptomyces sp. NPDC101206]|uniref:universal stress protein n=1 Tax=Streptomyces sp. NPDC101206 TaxID=3366128 RepID=UPI00382A8A8C